MNSFESYFQNTGFPLDCLFIRQDRKTLYEEYRAPFSKHTLHRMFSVAKSYTSLAIGALYAEGKLDLDAFVTGFFPEYSSLNPSEELRRTTVRNLLMMRSPYAKTTYKIKETEDWVKSFFEVSADHEPGMIFQYDTSAALVLGALVQRISGTGVLEYLRSVFLTEIGFSEDAYLMTAPGDAEHTGSGLMAYPNDLLVTGEFLISLLNNTLETDYPKLTGTKYDRAFWKKYADYVRLATSPLSATVHAGKTRSERYGYGYQFWVLPGNGFMMYGMGGQYLCVYPEKKLLFITTADTQSEAGGTQKLLDGIEKISEEIFGTVPTAEKDASGMEALYGNYRIVKKGSPFLAYRFTKDELILYKAEETYIIPYKCAEYAEPVTWKDGISVCAAAQMQRDGSCYLHARLVGEMFGCIHLLLCKTDRKGLLYIRKVEESVLNEFNGFFDSVTEE
ncbi:MAG: beta-lactamase family protein [Lachnospiraceae bacterium]|nr:beta-lactamase family protein [Lachnospiraceae bacterium]